MSERNDTLNLLRRAVGKIGLSIVEEERHGPSGAKTERGTSCPCAWKLGIMLTAKDAKGVTALRN